MVVRAGGYGSPLHFQAELEDHPGGQQALGNLLMERIRLNSVVVQAVAEVSPLSLQELVTSSLTKSVLVSSGLSKQVSAVSTIYIEEL